MIDELCYWFHLLLSIEWNINLIVTYKFCVNGVVVKELVEDLHEEVQIFGLVHANVCNLNRSLKAVHYLVALFPIVAVVKRCCECQRFTLTWLLEKLWTVRYWISHKCVEIVRTKADQIEYGSYDEVDCCKFSLWVWQFFFIDKQGVWAEIICELFKILVVLKAVDWFSSLEV